MALQFRRGTEQERQTITPKAGEPLYVTDTGAVYVGDGTTQGGTLLTAAVSDDTNPSLGGNLDLAGNDIVGTGNINIDGFITATGNINLGDGVEDNVIVGGVIGSNLIPDRDNAYDLGSTLSAWRTGYFSGIQVDTSIQAENLIVDNIVTQDSTELYNSQTGLLSAQNIEANTIEADLTGSVFGDDSSLIIDGLNNKLTITEIESTNEELEIITEGLTISVPRNDLLPLVSLTVYNGSINDPQPFNQGDLLGGFQIEGSIDDTAKFAGIFAARWADDADFTKERPASQIAFQASNNDDQADESLATLISGDGTLFSPILQTGSFADEDERDATISEPKPGMIILLRGLADSTESPRFQGFDGENWVDIS